MQYVQKRKGITGRKENTRKEERSILVVIEGEKTETTYFALNLEYTKQRKKLYLKYLWY